MMWVIIGVVVIVALCCAKVALDMAHDEEDSDSERARLERIRQDEADMRALLRGKRDVDGQEL